MADLVTGQFASQGIMAALLERARTGRGRHLEISMLDCMASLLTFNAGIYFTTGESPKRRGNTHATIAPYETFATSDGWLNIGVANDKFWQLFCGVIERPDLAADPAYLEAGERVRLRDKLVPIVSGIIAEKPRAHWIQRLRAAGVPYGDIRTVGEVCEAQQLTNRGMVIEMQHPTAGLVRNIDSPFRFDDRNDDVHRAPPLLGEHTNEILSELLNLSSEELDALHARGVIRSSGAEAVHG
jgi:crotonobetainyl-CoA:carnitine CoA-transferase CaiB-like acyl-CoA transferase